MKCEHCTWKECSKKTKTNDQENAAVNVRSPAQEKGEKREFHKLDNANMFLSDCLVCDRCVTTKEGVQVSHQNTTDLFCVLNLNKKCDTSQHKIMEQSDLALNDTAMDTLFGDMKEEEVRLHEGASSGGYQAQIFRHMAKALFNKDMGVLTYCTLMNKDFQAVTLERDGEILLCFEAAYGFWKI
ncbi:Nuclear prelamin A recognition factor [Myotis davidii]|uniref:Nuclear prelamin A recognition factor n=1 Tax=Myotis davidii TaxID=225400 RepID=L5LCS4_MYODS|nr:Nuclear prelamin A recognition factor [Myotis davidii]